MNLELHEKEYINQTINFDNSLSFLVVYRLL